MKYGKGLKPAPIEPHRQRVPFRMHAAAALVASLPAAVDLRETGLVAAVKDQGPVGSCTGHSTSGAVETAFALAGDPIGFVPSEDDLYRGGRCIDRARAARVGMKLPKLIDEGAQSEDLFSWMAQFGIRPRKVAQTSDGRNSDCELATVNDEEQLADVETDGASVIVGPYAIDPGAADAEDLVKAAIAVKIPVRIDKFVDSAWEDWTRSQPPVPAPNMADPNGGYHATYLVGYVVVNGVTYYIERNSWGESYGENGDVHISSACLRAANGLYPVTCRRAA